MKDKTVNTVDRSVKIALNKKPFGTKQLKRLTLVETEDVKQEIEIYHCLEYLIPLKSGEINVYAKDDIRIKGKDGNEAKIERKPEAKSYKKPDLQRKNIFTKYVLPIATGIVVPLIVAAL